MILLAVLLMVVQDLLAVPLVVAENRGRAWMAGSLDAAQDYANRFGAGICGAVLVKSGFGGEFMLVTAIAITSFFSTSFATRMSRRIKAAG